jgi:hypothetical protein
LKDARAHFTESTYLLVPAAQQDEESKEKLETAPPAAEPNTPTESIAPVYPPLPEKLEEKTTNLAIQTLESTISPVSIYKKDKVIGEKRVKFAVFPLTQEAWQGELETRRFICVEESMFEDDNGAVGKLLLRLTGLEVFGDSNFERVVDLELGQGDSTVISPPWTLPAGETTLDVQWESDWSVLMDEPFVFTVSIREMRGEDSSLKRSKTSRGLFGKGAAKSFSSRMLDKFSRKPSMEKLQDEQSSIKPSFSSLSFFSLANIVQTKQPQKVVTNTCTASWKVPKMQDWLARCTKNMHEYSVYVYNHPEQILSPQNSVARLKIEGILIPTDAHATIVLFLIRSCFQTALRSTSRACKTRSCIQKYGKKASCSRRAEIRQTGSAVISS